MNIAELELTYGSHVVILGAGASIASNLRNPEIHGMQLPSMNNLPDVVGLRSILDKFPKELIANNFEETYSNIATVDPTNPNLIRMNQMIYSYFSCMQLPETPTIYDYLIMSLREKDVIATFNWDPFLYQAWWRNYLHGSSPNLLFLHGNVAIGYNEEADMIGWAGQTSQKTGNYYEPTQLLFPVKHKDYSRDKFIYNQWSRLKSFLEKDKCNTHNVTIFGYSAPISDAEAMAAMKSAWGDVYSRNMEQFELIDIRPEDEVVNSWKDFIHTHHFDFCTDFFSSSLALYPRRTDEAYWCHYLPLTPEEAFVESNPVPKDFSTFDEMWEWYQPLIDSERKGI